jgi:hypothetical protein
MDSVIQIPYTPSSHYSMVAAITPAQKNTLYFHSVKNFLSLISIIDEYTLSVNQE